MTLTIDIPEAAAVRFQAVAAARGLDIPAFLIDAAFEAADAEDTVDEATLEALRVGIADFDAGRTLTLEEADGRLEQDVAEARARIRASSVS